MACHTPVDRDLPAEELERRIGLSIARPHGQAFAVPAGVELADGLDEQEAVALALWNQADFRAALSALRVAEADVEQAGLLPNPRLVMQFPVDSKQLEWLLGWSLDALWTRPRRVASERARWGAAAHRVVEIGLGQVAQVRAAYAEAWTAARLAEIHGTRAQLATQRAAILERRASRGEVTNLEVLTFASDATALEEQAWRARDAATEARLKLLEVLGSDGSLLPFELVEPRPLPSAVDVDRLREEALRSRPELIAARSELESAAERLGFEERAIVQLTAFLDSNGGGKHPFEIGPGLELEIPIFDRNQAGIARAQALLEQASWAYTGARRRIGSEVGRSYAAYVPAQASLERWNSQALPLFERSARLAMEAEQRGSVTYTASLAAQERLFDARAHAIELEAAARQALIALEASVGRGLDGD